MKRAELYNASIMGQLNQRAANEEMEKLRLKLYELDHEDEIEESEKRVEEKRKRLKALKAKRKKGA